MLPTRAFNRALQLRDSYIAISKYIRGRCRNSVPKSRRGFACQVASRNAELRGRSGETSQDDPPLEGSHQDLSTLDLDDHSPLAQYRRIFKLPRTTSNWEVWDLRPDQTSKLYGYVTSVRQGSKKLDFIDLIDPQLRKHLQLVVDEDAVGLEGRESIRSIPPHTPVIVSGQLVNRIASKSTMSPAETEGQDQASLGLERPKIVYYTQREEKGDGTKDKPFPSIQEIKYDPYVGEVATIPHIEMVVSSIQALNYFPGHIIAKTDTKFPPEQRHLQLRTSSNLRKTLQARSKAQTECRKYLFVKGFDEIETPILFKSTPEGAREFLVPTRQKGLAYALQQSPQQYKQILMASGISKYFQFARCFRDEDMRADRQPEFTQLDIEMSFACAEDVMKITERIIQVLWQTFFNQTIFESKIKAPKEYNMRDIPYHAPLYFPQITYDKAMTLWGSDKPDTRIGFHILQVEDYLDSTLKSKLSPLQNPVIDLLKVKVSNPEKTRHFISTFLDKPSNAVYLDNPHGVPGIFIFDPSKPMNGLSAFEHDAANTIVQLLHPQRGDLLVLQARPNQPFVGEGSTMMGNLRRDLHAALISEGIIRKPFRDEFLWVTDFPLFSPTNDSDPGQGGKAGIKSTHHPFTAPKTLWDAEKLITDPLSCKADHFDLVINGVEVGGGSRRIHDSKVQERVLRDILKVPENHVEEFRPLLEALRAGCPPHAGIALGFDRLMAILRQSSSVRDVIAFPKSAKGEDKMVGAPSSIDAERWAEYHMAVRGGEEGVKRKKEKDELTTGSKEADQELRSVADPKLQTPGPAQPDESDITPSTPS